MVRRAYLQSSRFDVVTLDGTRQLGQHCFSLIPAIESRHEIARSPANWNIAVACPAGKTLALKAIRGRAHKAHKEFKE